MTDERDETRTTERTAAPASGKRGHPSLNPSVTRRVAIKGVAAAGVVAVAASALAGCGSNATQTQAASPTVVDSDSATSVIDSYTSDGVDLPLTLQDTWTLPLGSVLHEGEGVWRPVVGVGSTASVMVYAGALSTSSGKVSEVVSAPVTQASNYQIYDARCSDEVFCWTEIDTLTHDWKLYASAFSAGSLTGSTSTLWEGTSDYEPPVPCCTGSRVIWQVMPSTSGTKTTDHSYAYVWSVGDSSATEAVDSPGRFAIPPMVSNGVLTLAPRVRASEGTYYGITAYEVSGDLSNVIDQLVLPASVKPFSAVRVGERFAFSVEANYSSGGLLSNMGTYIAMGDSKFVSLSREPFAPVAGRGDLFVIKSKASYFAVDVSAQTYSVLTAYDRSLDYGEYPASAGTVDTFVTYASVKDPDTGYPSEVKVRAFSI